MEIFFNGIVTSRRYCCIYETLIRLDNSYADWLKEDACAKKNRPDRRGGFHGSIHPGVTGRTVDYLAFISATVVSSMRLLKPHSLSYHDETFTRRPDTLVRVASKFDDAGLWLKSTDTSGSVL